MAPPVDPKSLETQLRACGFKTEELAEPEGMPEQLVLSSCAAPGISYPDLMREPWFARQPRRCTLAFERLKRTGRINFGHGFGEVWIVAEAMRLNWRVNPRPSPATGGQGRDDHHHSGDER